MEEYLAEVELIFIDYLSQKKREDYLKRKKEARRNANVKVIIDSAVAILGLYQYIEPYIDPYINRYIGNAINAIGLIHTAFGVIRDLKEVSKQQDFIHGYLMGRTMDKRLFRIEKGSQNGVY